MSFDVMAFAHTYQSKERASKYAGYIKQNILQGLRSIDFAQLANFICEGRPFILGRLTYTPDDLQKIALNKTKISAANRHWQSQQVFGIDVDNEGGSANVFADHLSVTDAINRCLESGMPPALVVTTYSHTKEHHHYRLFFCMDKLIEDRQQHDQVIYALMNVIAGNKNGVVDKRCKDFARLFYGSSDSGAVVYSDYDAIVSTDELLAFCPKSFNSKEKRQHKVKPACIPELSKIDCIRKLKMYDVDRIRSSWRLAIENAHKTGLLSDSWIPCIKSFIYIYTPVLMHGIHSQEERPILAYSSEHLFQLLSYAPLDVMLDVETNKSMSCILPGHEDEKPSAQIEIRKKDGAYSYHCYSCEEKGLDPLDFVQRIASCSFIEAKNYLCDLLGIDKETEEHKHRQAALAKAQEYILMDLPTEYPKLHSFMRRRNLHTLYYNLHTIARQYIYDTDNPDQHIIVASTNLIQEKLSKFYGRYIRPATLSKRLHLLAELGLIKILADKDCPPLLLSNLKYWQFQNKKRYRPTVYSFPLLSHVVLENATVVSANMLDKGIRTQYYSRVSMVMAGGQTAAENTYVHNYPKKEKETKELFGFYQRYFLTAKNLIAQKKWFTEQELIKKMRGYSEKKKQFYSGICLPKLLCEDTDFNRVICTKDLAAKLNIRPGEISIGHTKIIFSKEVLS